MSDHHDDGSGTIHVTFRGYVTGFILAAILTAIPFWLVMTDALGDKQLTAIIILFLAVVQIFVHMVYFLHMTPQAESGWSLMAAIFTIIVAVVVLVGSFWIMYHLDTNMMPDMRPGQGMAPT